MPDSPLIAAGAQVQPTAAAPLHTNEFFTGLWTNGNPLGPGAVPYLYSKYWSASRFDRLIGGANVEISTHLTPIRRPGCSVYNSSLFPPINRFFEWRGFGPVGEVIRLMVSCDSASGTAGSGTVRDATGPSTNTILQNKSANAGRTSFVNVGNNLYWGDGAETGMMVQSPQQWTANTLYQNGQWILDSNGNIEMAVGAQTASLIYIKTFEEAANRGAVWLYLSDATPLDLPGSGVNLYPSGLTTVPVLNGTTLTGAKPLNSLQIQASSSVSGLTSVAISPETGTVTTGNGITGAAQPAWTTTVRGVTQDGGQQWINMGSPVLPWGGAGPTVAPTVTQTPQPSVYSNWVPNTWYAPYFYIYDSNAGIQQLTTAGTLGPSQPTWGTTLNAVTKETSPGTAQWTCVCVAGKAGWVANTSVTQGQLISVSVVNAMSRDGMLATVTTTVVMQALNAGTTGATAPVWTAGLNTISTESTGLQWKNLGWMGGWVTMGAGATLSLSTTVIDVNGYLEAIQQFGVSGATQPKWANQGGFTQDTAATNPALWLNNGAWSAAGTGAWQYAWSAKCSITGAVTTASPLSVPITVGVDNVVVVQGPAYTPDPPWDTIVLWRTMQGGSDLFYLDEFPNAYTQWSYYDITTDTPQGNSAGLNSLIKAPINGMNNPPPANFIPICYYLGRIWGFSGFNLQYSNGPDQAAIAGAGDQGFNGFHQFSMQSKGITLWPTTIGLIVWTTSDVWAVLGQGTYDQNGNPISPFYMVQFQQGVGLSSQDALAINGSTGYAMLSSHQVISMDPSAGETEVGFPIGDQFDSNFDPSLCYLAWHQGRSSDAALYVADGASYWYRMAATAAPESGNVWSPAAQIAATGGKVKAIASVELAPGKRALLIGPSVNASPILMRDLTVSADNGIAYSASALIASVVLAQPGSGVAAVQFVVVEEAMISGATPIQVALMFDEISGSNFRTLRNASHDPPNLIPSQSVRVQRLWAAQDANTVVKCRHYQQQLTWAAEAYANELYTNTIYGRLPEKARK